MPANTAGMGMSEAEARAEGRREAAPVAVLALLVIVALALVSWNRDWELLGLPWWVWLLVALPTLLLTVDLVLSIRGVGLVRTRRAALVLLGLLVLGNFVALAHPRRGARDDEAPRTSSGGELLLTGFAIYSTDVIVFGLLFWELDAGGPAVRAADARAEAVRLPVPAGRSPGARRGRAGAPRPGTTSTSR